MNPLRGAGQCGDSTGTGKMLGAGWVAVPTQQRPSPSSGEEEETSSNRKGGRAEISWGELRVFGNITGF